MKKIILKDKLSKREQEVFKYLITGCKTNKIAEILGLKSNTISTMKRNIFLKLKVNSTIELYNLFLQA
jgi:DNA-binding NarL/FixJ family response regulator